MTPPKDITQGEWVKDGHVIRDDAGKEIASCLGDGRTFRIDIANARMMAASKGLAEVVNQCLPISAIYFAQEKVEDDASCVDLSYGQVRALVNALLKSGYTP